MGIGSGRFFKTVTLYIGYYFSPPPPQTTVAFQCHLLPPPAIHLCPKSGFKGVTSDGCVSLKIRYC